MATKKKYTTVEENLARRKYYNGTRPVATTNSGMGPVYVNTGDGKTADTYTPSAVHTFNLNGNKTANTAANSAPQVPTLDTANKPTYTPQEAFKAPEAYQSTPFNAPAAYQAPNAADYMKGNYNVGDFKSQWSDKLNSLYNEIAGRGKFTYDQSKDPLYQQYAEMYRKNAQLAMSDTVAKAASLTGGYGNSYAETAGQSMYNQTMDNLNERALDLYDRALNAWALEGENLNQRFNMAGQMYNNDYNAWRAKMQDAQYQQQFDYNRYLNDRDFGYNQWADNYNRARSEWEYDDQMNYQRDQDAWNRAWQQHTYAGDEARYAYEQANNDWRYANDYALNVYDRENQNYWNQQNLDFDREKFDWQKDSWQQEFDNNNYWRQTELDNDNYWRGIDQGNWEQQFAESQRQYDLNRGDSNYWNQQDYNLNNRKLAEDARQYDLSRGDSNYWNRQDDIYRNAQLAEQQRQYNLGYGLDAFNAGYDPATGTYSQANQQRYNDQLALDYAKLGMNPDGSLNAIGQMEADKIDAKAAQNQLKAYEGNTSTAQRFINNNTIPSKEQFYAALDNNNYSTSQVGPNIKDADKKGAPVGSGKNKKYYTKWEDYIDAYLDDTKGLTESEKDYLYWYYTH